MCDEIAEINAFICENSIITNYDTRVDIVAMIV